VDKQRRQLSESEFDSRRNFGFDQEVRGGGKMTKDWYEYIEEPIRNLIRLLRNNGFNTISSCGHLPKPYIQIEWYDEREDIKKLYDLLVDSGFKNFTITAYWHYGRHVGGNNKRLLELSFYCGMPWDESKISSMRLIKESEIRDIEEVKNCQ